MGSISVDKAAPDLNGNVLETCRAVIDGLIEYQQTKSRWTSSRDKHIKNLTTLQSELNNLQPHEQRALSVNSIVERAKTTCGEKIGGKLEATLLTKLANPTSGRTNSADYKNRLTEITGNSASSGSTASYDNTVESTPRGPSRGMS